MQRLAYLAGRRAGHPFDLHSLVETLIKTHSTIANAKSIHLSAVIAEDVPRHLIGNELRLRQILTNLLSTAIKFTDQGTVSYKNTIDNRFVIDYNVDEAAQPIKQPKKTVIF